MNNAAGDQRASHSREAHSVPQTSWTSKVLWKTAA